MNDLQVIEKNIQEKQKEIDKQRDINISLYRQIPVGYKGDEPALLQWREGSCKIKTLMDELNRLLDERKDLRQKENIKQENTFVNGYGEATKREITTTTYKRSQNKLDKQILSFMGNR